MKSNTIITIEQTITASIEKVWNTWTAPEHITQWNSASEDWYTPRAENDLRVGGSFVYRMEAKDGSFGFDFGGTYDKVEENSLIEYTLGDGRKVTIHFSQESGSTKIVESFETENEFPHDMQRAGWQSILDKFKNYCESL